MNKSVSEEFSEFIFRVLGENYAVHQKKCWNYKV